MRFFLPSENITDESVSRSIGRVLTWEEPKSKTPSSWMVTGQAVCVVHSRIMLTTTRVCFEGSKPLKLRVLYTPLNGHPPQSFSASLIRYSGSMNVAVLLLDTNDSPFRPVNIVAQNSPLLKLRGESIALVCFPLVTDLSVSGSALDSAEEEIVVVKSSMLTREPDFIPGAITSARHCQTTPSHKGITRNYQVAYCTYPAFTCCGGGGVFSLQLSADGTPQLLGIHTAVIYQIKTSKPHIASLVETEFDGASAELAATSNKRKHSPSSPRCAPTKVLKTTTSSASSTAAAAAAAAAAASSSSSSSSPIDENVEPPCRGNTTPEPPIENPKPLKLADKVWYSSGLTECVVADAVITNHAAWSIDALLAEVSQTPVTSTSESDVAAANAAAATAAKAADDAKIAAANAAANFAAANAVAEAAAAKAADLAVRAYRYRSSEEICQQQCSPSFIPHDLDKQCLYD